MPKFPSTAWSTIRRLGESSTREVHLALEDLCTWYWLPLYSFLRRSGMREKDAEETIQSFFLNVVERNALEGADASKGRFRTFLIASLKNFLANERRRERAQKRSPAEALLSLDDHEAEHRYSNVPCATLTPDESYERAWSVAMVERAISTLRARETDPSLEVVLAFALSDGGGRSYRIAAAEIGISEAAFKVRVSRLRKRLGNVLRDLVRETVSREELIDGELKHLLALWGRSGA